MIWLQSRLLFCLFDGNPLTTNASSGSDWGGTTIEAWLPNTTFTDANPKCKGSTGNVTGPQAGVNGGELFNGMMMPFSQMAVAGALWYRKIATPPSRF